MSEIKTAQDNRGYPLWLCHHGYKPEYCAQCLIAGAIPPLGRKGTGFEGGGWSHYIYIQPQPKIEPAEELTRPSFCTTVSERVYITTSWGHASKGGSQGAVGDRRAAL